MNRLLYILPLTLILLCASCTRSELSEYVDGPASATSEYLQLKLSMPASGAARTGDLSGGSTRAGETWNPTGGETGDGLREGLHHENDVNDLVLFQINHPLGINAPDDTPVKKVTYVRDINFHPTQGERTLYVDIDAKEYKHQQHDYFIVAINTGDFNAYTLRQLRDHIVDRSFRSSPDGIKANYTNFVMANANATQTYIQGTGTKTNPNVIEMDVERMAARIDFCPDGTNGLVQDPSDLTSKVLEYSVTFPDDPEPKLQNGRVLLSHVSVINAMQQPTYLIKRLAAGPSAEIHYLADEQDPSAEYVVEPRTWSKSSTSRTQDQLTLWYGATRYSNTTIPASQALNGNYFTAADRIHSGTGNAFTDGTSFDIITRDNYYVLDYVNENTMPMGDIDRDCVTGLMLKAKFVPARLISTYVSDDNYSTVAGTAGETFWRYYIPATGKSYYFTSQTVLDQFRTVNNAYAGIVTEYPKGDCYYYVWIKHERLHDTADGNDLSSLMQFGIVRNNIYRIQVDFTGPGFTLIGDQQTPLGIQSYIYTRRWNLINHPTIEL